MSLFFVAESTKPGTPAVESDVAKFIADQKTAWTWNVVDGDRKLLTAFSANAIPLVVFADARNMEVVYADTSAPTDTSALIQTHLAEVRGRPAHMSDVSVAREVRATREKEAAAVRARPPAYK